MALFTACMHLYYIDLSWPDRGGQLGQQHIHTAILAFPDGSHCRVLRPWSPAPATLFHMVRRELTRAGQAGPCLMQRIPLALACAA